MPKRLIKRYLPNDDFFKQHKHLRWLGRLLHDANLWHLNRHCVARAFAIGFFCAFMPMPFQMLLASLFAIGARANLPLSVALVWISNPITMPPMFYGAYKIGELILQPAPSNLLADFSLNNLWQCMGEIWQPLLVGTFILGLIFSGLSYVCISVIWRWAIIRKWRLRAHRRRLQNASF